MLFYIFFSNMMRYCNKPWMNHIGAKQWQMSLGILGRWFFLSSSFFFQLNNALFYYFKKAINLLWWRDAIREWTTLGPNNDRCHWVSRLIFCLFFFFSPFFQLITYAGLQPAYNDKMPLLQDMNEPHYAKQRQMLLGAQVIFFIFSFCFQLILCFILYF